MPYVRVTLLQSQQSILTQFDVKLQRRAIDGFARAGVELRTGVRVVEVTQVRRWRWWGEVGTAA